MAHNSLFVLKENLSSFCCNAMQMCVLPLHVCYGFVCPPFDTRVDFDRFGPNTKNR